MSDHTQNLLIRFRQVLGLSLHLENVLEDPLAVDLAVEHNEVSSEVELAKRKVKAPRSRAVKAPAAKTARRRSQ